MAQDAQDQGPAEVDAFCPVCATTVTEFVPGGVRTRPRARCPRCGALERHRFLALLVEGLGPTLSRTASVLDIAPSRYTTTVLDALDVDRYVRVDLDPAADGRAVDVRASLTALPFGDATFDLVVCYHVLEHIPDDASAMRELARVLTQGGHALVQVPFRGRKATDEDPDASEAERIERFGQADHVRWYGRDFEDRLAAAGLTGVRVRPADVLGEQLCARFGSTPRENVWIVRRVRDGEVARVGPATLAPARVLRGLHEATVVEAERSAALRAELAAVTADRDRVKSERDRVRADRDRWRSRHERLTGHPLVRSVAAPYRWWTRRR